MFVNLWKNNANARVIRSLQNKIMEALLKANEFEAPPSLVERQIFYMISDTQKRMKSAGMDEKNAMESEFSNA